MNISVKDIISGMLMGISVLVTGSFPSFQSVFYTQYMRNLYVWGCFLDQVVRRNNISKGTGWSHRSLFGKGAN